MMASWVANLGFAGGGAPSGPEPGTGGQIAHLLATRRPYGYGYRYMVRGLTWLIS